MGNFKGHFKRELKGELYNFHQIIVWSQVKGPGYPYEFLQVFLVSLRLLSNFTFISILVMCWSKSRLVF